MFLACPGLNTQLRGRFGTFAIDQDREDFDGRRRLIALQVIRVDHDHAGGSGKPEAAVFGTASGGLHAALAFETQLTGGERKAGNGFAFAIGELSNFVLAQTKDTFAGGEPEIRIAVAQNAVDPVVVEAVFDIDVGDDAVFPAQQTGAESAHPNGVSLRIEQEAIDGVGGGERAQREMVLLENVKGRVTQARK